jgi:hypothetical protein
MIQGRVLMAASIDRGSSSEFDLDRAFAQWHERLSPAAARRHASAVKQEDTE